MNTLLKFEIPALWKRERVTANCSCCGLCFLMKNQMLKVCISAVTSNNLKRENHNSGQNILKHLRKSGTKAYFAKWTQSIFYLFKKAWECYSKSLFLLPPLSSSSLCAVPNIGVKRLNPSLSIIIGREVLEKLKENT